MAMNSVFCFESDLLGNRAFSRRSEGFSVCNIDMSVIYFYLETWMNTLSAYHKNVVTTFTNKEILTTFECFNIVTDNCDVHSFESIVTIMNDPTSCYKNFKYYHPIVCSIVSHIVRITARKQSLGQGNDFAPVCSRGRCLPTAEVCLRGICIWEGLSTRGVYLQGGLHLEEKSASRGEEVSATRKAGGMHPTGMLSCLIPINTIRQYSLDDKYLGLTCVETFQYLCFYLKNSNILQ